MRIRIRLVLIVSISILLIGSVGSVNVKAQNSAPVVSIPEIPDVYSQTIGIARIHFTATDSDVLSPTFVLFGNSTQLASGNWTPGVETEVLWDLWALPAGSLCMNLTVYDGLGLSVSISWTLLVVPEGLKPYMIGWGEYSAAICLFALVGLVVAARRSIRGFKGAVHGY
jgi:hypothetical protein